MGSLVTVGWTMHYVILIRGLSEFECVDLHSFSTGLEKHNLAPSVQVANKDMLGHVTLLKQ